MSVTFPNRCKSSTLYIGRGGPVNLLVFLEQIEGKLGKPALCKYPPMQKGDVPVTFADTNLLKRLTGYRPRTEVRDGIGAVIDWYKAWGPLKGA